MLLVSNTNTHSLCYLKEYLSEMCFVSLLASPDSFRHHHNSLFGMFAPIWQSITTVSLVLKGVIEMKIIIIIHQSGLCALFCRYKITTGKPTGAIAGIQRVDNGLIEWSSHLPHSCQLSQYDTS